mmetsp:Transcript_656/g.1925  ORF Transcript_656/g.1925 Transcript_656/m.1925 type:complete len:208 (+) Transcript_656:490-1113(+)
MFHSSRTPTRTLLPSCSCACARDTRWPASTSRKSASWARRCSWCSRARWRCQTTAGHTRRRSTAAASSARSRCWIRRCAALPTCAQRPRASSSHSRSAISTKSLRSIPSLLAVWWRSPSRVFRRPWRISKRTWKRRSTSASRRPRRALLAAGSASTSRPTRCRRHANSLLMSSRTAASWRRLWPLALEFGAGRVWLVEHRTGQDSST